MLVPGVNTYADLSYMNTYLNKDFNARTAWNALTEEDKELYASIALQLMEKLKWIGKPSSPNQSLKFPRDFQDYVNDPRRAINYNHYAYFTNENPYLTNTGVLFEDLKKAQCEIVIDLLTTQSNDSVKQLKTLQDAGVANFSVASLSFTFRNGETELPLPEQAYKLLRYYLEDEMDVMRIERG